MHINNRTGTPSTLRAAPQSQPDPAPSEQHTDDQKEADKQKLPRYEVKDSHASLERFRSFHDEAGKASVEDDTSANAETEADKSSASAAEGSVARRRRGSRARKKDSAGQSAESSAGRGRDAVPSRNCPLTPVSFLLGLSMLTGWLFREPITGLLFNGGTQPRVPLPNSDSPVTQARVPLPNFDSPINYGRVDERLLQDARHAVLELFGSYIPEDAPCYRVDAEISDDVPHNAIGAYYPYFNRLRLSPTGCASLSEDERLHVAMHEYCHCFTHPQFDSALEKYSPFNTELVEALTEHILRSGKMTNSNKYKMPKFFTYEAWQRELQIQKLEKAVGEATLMRAYFSGDEDAISEILRAARRYLPQESHSH